MKPYIEKLKTYLAENPPNYGDCDVNSILEMLYNYIPSPLPGVNSLRLDIGVFYLF